jgi:hypothetical protein
MHHAVYFIQIYGNFFYEESVEAETFRNGSHLTTANLQKYRSTGG